MLYVLEEFPEHPKWEELQEKDPMRWILLVGIWNVAACDCKLRLTDGKITLARLEHISRVGAKVKPLAEQLCDLKFWKRISGGYEFHDWAKIQDTKVEVQDRREKWKKNKRRQRMSSQVSTEDTPVDTSQDSQSDSSLDSNSDSTQESSSHRVGMGWDGNSRREEAGREPRGEHRTRDPMAATLSSESFTGQHAAAVFSRLRSARKRGGYALKTSSDFERADAAAQMARAELPDDPERFCTVGIENFLTHATDKAAWQFWGWANDPAGWFAYVPPTAARGASAVSAPSEHANESGAF